MRMPQVSDRIKEVPAQALRGVFAGIGQVLLITDRLRNKMPAHQQVPQARRPERSETAAETAPEAPKAAPAETAPRAEKAAPAEARAARAEKAARAEARDFDKTGNVRLLAGTGAGAGDVAKITNVEEPTEVAVTEEAAVTTAGTEATAPGLDVAAGAGEAAAGAGEAAAGAGVAAAGAGVAAAGAGEADVPLPNYDELSIASLRARLRNLDVAQVRQLAEYERAHAARADVIAMFERRIAKLEAETHADAQAEETAEAKVEAEVEARTEVEADTEAEVEAEAEAET